MKIMLIAGARPNFMKVASIVHAIRAHNHFSSSPVDYLLVHTGQHYDKEMSDSFFTDLELPVPHVNLGVGSSSHARQTADIMKGIEPVLLKELPEAVVVVGDVNSTIACALVAAKIVFPADSGLGMSRPLIAHVEAGLRSFDRSMPEEINRVLTDALCDLLFVTERDAEENLLREGVAKDKIHLVGNTMVDTLLRHRRQAQSSEILNRLGLIQNGSGVARQVSRYGVVTLHRPSNVDNQATFLGILEALATIGQRIPIFFPVHPRTVNRIKEFRFDKYFDFATHFAVHASQSAIRNPKCSPIHCLESLSYFDFLCLMDNAKLVVTDSGGIQEETTMLGVPCVTVRENTERPVTISRGTNVLAGTSTEAIIHHCMIKLDNPGEPVHPERWDGHAGERIVEILAKHILNLSCF